MGQMKVDNRATRLPIGAFEVPFFAIGAAGLLGLRLHATATLLDATDVYAGTGSIFGGGPKVVGECLGECLRVLHDCGEELVARPSKASQPHRSKLE